MPWALVKHETVWGIIGLYSRHQVQCKHQWSTCSVFLRHTLVQIYFYRTCCHSSRIGPHARHIERLLSGEEKILHFCQGNVYVGMWQGSRNVAFHIYIFVFWLIICWVKAACVSFMYLRQYFWFSFQLVQVHLRCYLKLE